MKKIALLCCLFFLLQSIQAQNKTKPEYEGGKAAIEKYIIDNLEIPKQRKNRKWHPTVKVKFLLRRDGKVDLVHSVSTPKKYYDSEAIRIIKSMPDWKPATRNSKAIAVYKTIHINFNLLPPILMVEEAMPEPRFIIVSTEASVLGGDSLLYRFINSNLRYPVIAQENGIQGKVFVEFTIEKDGSVNNVKVVRGFDPFCDKEAVRVVKSMPKWIPAKQMGRVVSRRILIPIRFQLK